MKNKTSEKRPTPSPPPASVQAPDGSTLRVGSRVHHLLDPERADGRILAIPCATVACVKWSHGVEGSAFVRHLITKK